MASKKQYVKTNYIDVLDKATAKKLLELDLSRGINEAAKQFAAWWNGGILLRSADPKAPALTDAEIMAVAGRKGVDGFADLSGYDFATRYVDRATGRVAYPEPHATSKGGYVFMSVGEDGYTSKGHDVGALDMAIDAMCHRVVYDEPEKQAAQRDAIAADLRDTQAARYAEGLERVKALNARGELRAQIMAVRDDATRRKLMGEYPELFDVNAARAMAEGIRMESYDADVAAWQAGRTPQADAEAAHAYDTAGTNYVVTSTVPGEGEGGE